MHFSYRSDIGQYLDFPVETRVSQRFSVSFDANSEFGILHFTAVEGSMTPFSLLIPEEVADAAQSGWPLELSQGCLTIGKYTLSASDPLSEIKPFSGFDASILSDNLRSIRRSLLLFGRQSPVFAMLFQPATLTGILCEVLPLLTADVTDLQEYARFSGIGTGLTPSFDDFFAGMLFIDRFIGYNRLTIADPFFQAVSKKTTRQAVQQYRFAAKGHFSRQFELFAAALATQPASSAELLRLLAWGHSSGTDILCGIWHYLSRQVKINR